MATKDIKKTPKKKPTSKKKTTGAKRK